MKAAGHTVEVFTTGTAESTTTTSGLPVRRFRPDASDPDRLAAAAGLEVVMDRCVKIEHCRFFGKKDYGLDVVGLQTGVLTSDRYECIFPGHDNP